MSTLKMAAGNRQRYGINKNKFLLDREFDQLEMLLNRNLFKDTRNCLILFLALHTGARASEILDIQKKDLDAFDQTVFIRGLKNSNDREIPVPSWLFEALEDYSKTIQGEVLFPISYHRLRQVWQDYRPANKKFHSLRHTFALRLYKKAKDIRLLQIALGHRNITNTMVYADFVYTQTEMRRLIL